MAPKRPGSDSVVGEAKKKHKHMTISVQQKMDLLRKLDKDVSVRTLCQQYNIGSSTVYDIKKQKNELLKFYSESDSKKSMDVRKTLKERKSSDLDSALIQWFKLRRSFLRTTCSPEFSVVRQASGPEVAGFGRFNLYHYSYLSNCPNNPRSLPSMCLNAFPYLLRH